MSTTGPDAHEFHIICQTHWDREWRLSFQQTRVMLVDMLDHLLAMLENDPAYRHYHLDGQTILLEDYLDIRPENRERLARLIAAGRILVGPWYTLPEENLVDGECLVRNLLVGHAVARGLGGVMKAGFTPTSYGQISQMPQIYAGFGIDSILFHRGVPSDQVGTEYLWTGSDGTQILGIRPSLGGRFNFSTLVMNPLLNAENGEAPYSPVSDRELRRACAMKDEQGVNGDNLYYSDAVPQAWEPAALRQAIVRLQERTAPGATTRFLLCGEGHDLMEPNPVLPRIVEHANALLGGQRLMISALPDYIARVKASARELKVLKGELRATQKDESGARLYAGTLSSRMYLKQLNRRAEALLIRWAEPFAALLWTLGEPYPRALLQKAWKHLLANHAHDSISGTGTDQVHDDMTWRFAQCEQIARELTRKALSTIATRVDAPRARAGDPLITVFNPLPFERDEVIQLDVDLPVGTDHPLCLWDPADREVPFHEVCRTQTIHTVQQTHGFPYRFYAAQRRISFLAGAVPALGYKTYRLERLEHPAESATRPVLADSVCVTGPGQMENAHLRVTIKANGTLCILDKSTGRTFDGLNAFEDCGEIGDSYDHTKPAFDTVVTSHDRTARIECVEESPYAVAFEVTQCLDLPEAVTADKQRRSDRHRPLNIRSRIMLALGARRVDVVTRVCNQVKDHRLRVLLPTNIDTDECWVHGQFDLLRRPISRPDGTGWIEPPCPTQPQLSVVDLHDSEAGLAVINRGLPEYEVVDDRHCTVALTLLRCFTHKTRSTQADDPEQVGTQCLGDHEFHYAIYPHAGDTLAGEVLTEAARHNHPLRAVQSWSRGETPGSDRGWPLEMSGLALSPRELIVTGIKQSEDGRCLVVRFFNPAQDPLDGRLRLHADIAQAVRLDLQENVVGACQVENRRAVAVRVEPKQIVTLGLTPAYLDLQTL